MDRETERDFTAYVRARSSALFRSAMALTGQRQQAEDLLQTVLAKAARHWPRIRTGNPDAYLRRSMYLQAVSWWRRLGHGREVVDDQVAERVISEDDTGRVDTRLDLVSALRALRPNQRAVLALRYFEDLPDDQIAEILGCRPATVRSHVLRALQRLRELYPDLIALEQESLR